MKRHKTRKLSALPRLVVLAGGVLLLGLLAFVAWPRAETPGATAPASAANPLPPVDPSAPGRLSAVETTVDLGRVPFDRTVEGRYELTNTGGGPVRLVDAPQVKTLEGC